MVRIAWRMLWQRPANVIATLVALWFAVVVVTATGAMLESGLRYHGQVHRYAAATAVVATTTVQATSGSGPDRETDSEPLAERAHLPGSLVATIAGLPGVTAAIGDVAVPSRIVGNGSAVEVHPWAAARLAPYPLVSGVQPDGPDQAVVDAGLGVEPGQTVRLDLAAGVRAFTVSGVAAAPGTVFVTGAEAAVLGGDPTTIGVLAAPGVDATRLAASIQAVLPHVDNGALPQVHIGAGRGSAESPAVAPAREFVIAVSGAFGGMTLLIAILVIAGTVGLSVQQRHRDVALLRAVAATPRQVRRMVLREAFVLGIVSGLAGVWPGLAAAGWLRDQFVTRGMVPASLTTRLSWLPPLVAASAALLIALVAAWITSLRASRIRPTAALAETAVERRGIGVIRTLVGLVALAGGIVLAALSESVNGDSAASVSVGTVFTLVTAVALLAPLLIRTATATVGRVLHSFGVTGRLAVANTATSARRLSSVIGSLVLAVALGGSLWFVQTSEVHATAEQSRDGLLADYVIAPGGPGLPDGAAAAIRATPGVTAATGVSHSTLYTRHGGIIDLSAQGVDPEGLARTLDLGVRAGSIAALRGDTVAVDSLTADTLRLRVGSQFDGWYGDGMPAHLRVVAIYRRGLGFAELTVPRPVLAPHTSTGRADSVLVSATPAAATALARDYPVVDRASYQVALGADMARNGWANRGITLVLLVYVTIAALNTLVMAVLGRRREFAVLRLSGTTRRQVIRMARLEQVLLLGLALVLGGAVAAATLIPMVKGLTGSASPYIPPLGWVTVLGGVIALGLVATAVPVRRVLRTDPVDAIGIRE